MKLKLAIVFYCLLSTGLFAQTASEPYSRVRISLEGKDIAGLTRMGIETDHGLHAPGKWLVADLSATELQQVQAAGFDTKIWIADLKKDYMERRAQVGVQSRGGDCDITAVTPYETPLNYTFGSMGGYHTLDEMMAVLDDMHAKFPNLVSARQPISDTIETWEGRKQYFVKLSDNPETDEAEPEVLYTALHHAREPNSASNLLFYMWYLLENYNSDPEIQYILNNAELYFVPCLNPDGYVYNQSTDPQGGGFWRKNRRDNGDGTFGVDLNRNYGHFWGNDDDGSSPNPAAATYRGPSAFSEPETRALRDFTRAREFVFALNYHTYSNLLIYPWAYSNELADPSLAVYAKLFTRENNYKAGTSIETVGYNVNGSSDDWMYAEKGVNSYTPEVGTTGFWPQPNEIDDLNRENMWQNLSMALSALRFGEAIDKSPNNFSTLQPQLTVDVVRYGHEDGPFTVTLTPLTNNILNVADGTQVITPAQLETKTLNFALTLDPAITVGTVFSLQLELNNGFYSRKMILHKTYGGKTVSLFEENGDNLFEWSGGWGKTGSTFVSAPFSVTDSPDGEYDPITYTEIQMADPGVLIPNNAVNPQLRFWAKWNIEPNYDYVQVRAGNIFSEEALCGRYTNLGVNGAQPFDEPVFDGEQSEWVEECMDLSDYIGQEVIVRFVLGSDNGDERDGFYFDDLRITYTDPTLLNTVQVNINDFILLSSQPNPAAQTTTIHWTTPENMGGPGMLLVYNALGEQMGNYPLDLSTQHMYKLQTADWPSGVYSYMLQTTQGQSRPAKLMVAH